MSNTTFQVKCDKCGQPWLVTMYEETIIDRCPCCSALYEFIVKIEKTKISEKCDDKVWEKFIEENQD